MRPRHLVPALLALALLPAPALAATPSSLPGTTTPSASSAPVRAVPTAITTSDFLTRAQIRARLDFARPLSDYWLSPVDNSPEPDPDCAPIAAGAPAPLDSSVDPARRARSQYFDYEVPGAAWTIQGRAIVLEYTSRAKARAAYRRVVASVKAHARYELLCEAINPIVTGQARTAAVDVAGTSFTWRYHLRAARAGSWRDVISTRGNRVVWVELGREFTADLDWSGATPPPVFPRYPSLHYLQRLASGAISRGL